MKNLTTTENKNVISVNGELSNKAQEFYVSGLQGAKNTQLAYVNDFKQFVEFCQNNNLSSLPATENTIIEYCTFLAETSKVATILRKVAAINKYHTVAGFDAPTSTKQFKIFIKGIMNSKGIAQKQSQAFTIKDVAKKIGAIDTSELIGLRDKALLLIGFCGAYRRSELVSIQVSDLSFDSECLVINSTKSKTNQLGELEQKCIYMASNPVLNAITALKEYLKVANITEGFVFRNITKGGTIGDKLSVISVNAITKKVFGNKFSAHSLRTSFITIAVKNGASDSEIMHQTKHKTTKMIAKYTRLDNIKEHNAGMKLGI
jgi:site-specific recombinase XerD